MNDYILSGGGAVEIVSWDNLRGRVNELSGREVGPYVAAKVGAYGSTEVACKPGSPGDLQFGRSFTVRLAKTEDIGHCPESPDGSHCAHWWDGDTCGYCKAPPLGNDARAQQGMSLYDPSDDPHLQP